MAEKTNLDLNGPNFNPNLYLDKIFKEYTLRQIMDLEHEVVRDTQTLHSDMQTLVYENYNKFISATDTIKKMKTDFKKMEDEMDLLISNMQSITSLSDTVDHNLLDTRNRLSHLNGVHTTLQKLQFLFKLPASLKTRMEEKNYVQATQDYLHAQRVLHQYGDMPAFEGIKKDCHSILSDLKTELRRQFCSADSSTKDITESVDLLLQLDEPAKEICLEFLSTSEKRLSEQLVLLQDQTEQRDISEFIDMGTGFLSDLCLIVAAFYDMFLNRMNNSDGEFENYAAVELESFVKDNMERYFALVQSKVDQDQDIMDTASLVRALDQFYTRIDGNKFSKDVNFSELALDIIGNAARKQCRAHLHGLKLTFTDILTKIKQTLATPKLLTDEDSNKNLGDLLQSMIITVVEKTKGVLQDLLAFINPEVAFARKARFQDTFCLDNVREGLMVKFLLYLTDSVKTCMDDKVPPTLILLLSRFCLDFKTSVQFLLSKTDELFRTRKAATSEADVSDTLQQSAQFLLNCYVQVQGNNCSHMLRKSVETRDWLNTIEPRTVRAVMKRVVEDISAIDATVALLYQQGSATANSSDSSRKTQNLSVSRLQYRSTWTGYTSNSMDSTLVSSMHKLFSERVEIFSPVEFNKVSILTGIIKISLKTFMECVRLKTFSKYGLQQIQVDTHYLQLYLWRFVADENLVHFLLDEILGSAVHRCLEPVLMEPSVVDIICERG